MTKRLPAWLDWRIPAVLAAALIIVASAAFLDTQRHDVTRVTRITVHPRQRVVTAAPRVRLIPPLRAHRNTPKATPHRAPSQPTASPAPSPTPSCLPLPIGVCVHAR